MNSIESLNVTQALQSRGNKQQRWHEIGLCQRSSKLSERIHPFVSPFSESEIIILGGYNMGALGDGYILKTKGTTLEKIIGSNQ